MGLGLLGLLTLANLRGLVQSRFLLILPSYLFVVSMLALLGKADELLASPPDLRMADSLAMN